MLAAATLSLFLLAAGDTVDSPPSPPPAAVAPATNIEEELRRAKNEYAYGNYDAAADHLRELLYPMRLTSDEQVIEARKYLALSYYLLDRLDEVGEEFAKLLYLDPDYELDPFTVAPPVIEIFESIRRQLKPELDVIRQRKSDAQLEEKQLRGIRRTVTTTVLERSELATLMPFGIGQFQNGQDGWGTVFAASEVALLGINVAAYLGARSHSTYDEQDASSRRLVQQLTVAQYASLALFGLVWSLGVFQARLYFVPSVTSPPVVVDEPIGAKSAVTPLLGIGGRF